MSYKYMVLAHIAPKDAITELNEHGKQGYQAVFFQPIQEITGTLLNGQPNIKLFYDIYLMKHEKIEDSFLHGRQ